MKANGFSDIRQGFCAVLALANATRKAGDLCYHIAILAGI
jgi:hypothetical protein